MGLTKITANYTERAVERLDKAVRLGRENQTDTLNRAIKHYADVLEAVLDENGRPNGKKISVHGDQPVTITVHPDGTTTINVEYETFNILP